MPNQSQSIQITLVEVLTENTPQKTHDFGDYLRKQRMLRGVTHQEIVNITKIRPHYIEAIENNAFEKLPPKTFVIGFLRAMSQYLGLDQDDVVSRYLVSAHEYEKLKSAGSVVEQKNKTTHLLKKKPVRFLAWLTGALLFFFLITLPHFIRQ